MYPAALLARGVGGAAITQFDCSVPGIAHLYDSASSTSFDRHGLRLPQPDGFLVRVEFEVDDETPAIGG